MTQLGLIPLGVMLSGVLGASLLLAVRVAYRMRRRPPDELSLVLRLIGWLLLLPLLVLPVLALGAGLLQVVGRVSPGFAVFVVVVLVLPLFSYAVSLRAQLRDSNRRSLLWSLAVADERGMPLGDAARAMAWDHCGRFGAFCETVAHRIDSGVRLDEALQLRQPDAALAVKVGLFHQRLGASLRRWLARREARVRGPQRYHYLLMVSGAVAVILPFLFAYIAPAMMRIGGGMNARGLGSMQLLAEWGAFYRDNSGWLLPLTAAPAALLLLSTLHELGWLGRDSRLFGRLAFPLDAVRILRSLAEGARAGAPLEQTLGLLSSEYPKRRVRLRLAIACQQQQGGRLWTDALQDARIIGAAESALLQAAQPAGNLDWALEQVADSKRHRIESRLGLLDAVLYPLVTLLVGAIVALMGYSLFQSLTMLIEVAN